MAFHPYLNFGRNCREAFTRYQEIFGGELSLMAMSDMPADEGMEISDDQADLVMHAALTFSDHLLMASDTGADDFAAQGMYVNYTVADLAEAERVFTALADGGEAEMPFERTFWSPGFGVCVDRFGTPWMVSAEGSDAD